MNVLGDLKLRTGLGAFKKSKIFFFSKLKETTREADILRGYVYLELGEQEQLQVRVHHCLEKTVKEREGEGGGKQREVVGEGERGFFGKVGKRERWGLGWGEGGGGWKSGEEREVGVRMGRKRWGGGGWKIGAERGRG